MSKLLKALFAPGGRIVPGRARARAIESSPERPSEVDVVVIGAGYIGCLTALELVERGLSVAICEKGVVAGEASGRSLGWVDSQFLDPVKMELITRSKALWRGMNERVGADTGFRETGVVSLFQDAEGRAAAEDWLSSVRDVPGADGIDARIVSGTELEALIPAGPVPWLAGLYQPSDAAVEPRLAVPAIADAARDAGATLLQGCAVRGVEFAAGRVCGVVTELGAISCGTVVLAGNYWSPLFARRLGIRLPQFQAHASWLRTEPLTGPDVSAWGAGYAWKPNIDGGYTIGAVNGAVPITPQSLANLFKLLPAIRAMWSEVDPVFSFETFWRELRQPGTWPLDGPSPFEANRILEPEIRHGVLDRICSRLAEDFPAFAGAREAERWGGVLVTTPDNMPVISEAPDHPGLLLGTGFYYGVTMGPAAAEALADLATGRTPRIDLSLYRAARFGDGSPLVFRS